MTGANYEPPSDLAVERAIADNVLVDFAGVLKVDGGLGDEAGVRSALVGKRGEAALAGRVAAACELCDSAGRSLKA
jgi:fructose-bisphosphate aldolase class II